MMNRVIAALCTVAAGAVVFAGGSDTAAASSALVVDDDGAQCENAAFTSIQAAVATASPGDAIMVCPGVYNERVTVAKPDLTIRAHHRSAGDCFAPAWSPDPTREAVVSGGPGGVAFALAADGISLIGFVITGSDPGIDTSQNVSGFRIEQNVLVGNVIGLRSGSSGVEPSRVRDNCFRANGTGPAGGGIVSLLFPPPTGPRVLNKARIDHNDFFGNNFGVRLGASRDVTVDHNTSLQDTFWMRNGGIVDVTITHNLIGAGALDGIVFFPLGGSATGAPNANVIVSHNEISGRGRDGIVVAAGSSLIDSVISHNAIADNGRDGIRIESGANAANVVEHNALSGNGEHDCHDDTVGHGTGGTANVWEKNNGETQNRPGLCER